MPKVQAALETVEVQQFAVHRQGVLRLLRHHKLSRHHRNSCGRFRGSSSFRRRLSTRQVLVIQSPEDRVRPTGAGRGHDRRCPSCVTTPSTDSPDDAATTEVSQSQQLVRRGLARDGTETDRENPEDCRQDTRTDRRDIYRSPRRSRSLLRYHELFRDRADRPEDRKDFHNRTSEVRALRGQTRPSEVRA